MKLKPILTSLSLGFASLITLWLIMNLGRPLPVAHAAGSPAPLKSAACGQPAAICVSPAAALARPARAAIPLRATIVVTIPVSKDNTIYGEDGTKSLGAGQNIFAGRTGPTNGTNIRRGLIAFNITNTIPAGAIIESATLRLYLTLSPSGPSNDVPISLHRLAADWGEGTSIENGPSAGGDGSAATIGDVTWTHRFSNTLLWATPGGNFVATPSATTAVGTNPIAPYTWSSAQMAADVQLWLDNPTQNFGWILKTDELNNQTARRFASKEFMTAANRPILVVTYTEPEPELAISKTVSDPTPGALEDITYTIVVSNPGNAPATNVTVFDQEPNGLDFDTGSIDITPPGGDNNSTGGQITIDDLTINPGQPVTITFNATIDNDQASGNLITNTATVTNAQIAAPVTDSVTLTVTNLAISKTASNLNPEPGEVVTFTLVVTNVAGRNYGAARIGDTLPPGLAFGQFVDQPNVTENFVNNTVIATRTVTLAPNGIMTVIFSTVVSENLAIGDIITNTAGVVSNVNLNPTFASAVLVLSLPPTGLGILKQVNKTNPQAGETITYTVGVVNVSPTIDTDIHVSDTLPGGVTFLGPVRITPPGTLITPTLPTLASGLTLAAGERLTLTFPVRVNPGVAAGTILINTASVTSAQVITPETGAAVVTVAPSPVPILVLTKGVNNPTPQTGSLVTYTLLVTNTGLANATGGRISDTLPAGLTFIGPISLNPPASGTPGNAGTLPALASNVLLNAGQRLTLTFPVRVNSNVVSGTVITNRASVTSTQVATPAIGQVSLRAIGSPTPTTGQLFLPLILKTLPAFPDLVGSFTLTPNQANFAAGMPVLITVVVTNVGAATADSFWVDFYINPAVAPGVNIPWNQTCSLSPCYGLAWFVSPGLGPGESVTLTSTPGSYAAPQTIWPGSFAAGTRDLYLYVDSWNPTVDTGGVFESNELNNGAERHGLTVSGLTTSGAGLPDPAQLPPRPAP